MSYYYFIIFSTLSIQKLFINASIAIHKVFCTITKYSKQYVFKQNALKTRHTHYQLSTSIHMVVFFPF